MRYSRVTRVAMNCLGIRYRLPPTASDVLLTFDDGPTTGTTPAVLERLEAHGARAVFFLVGRRIDDAPELLDDIRARGHIIANHSYSHWRYDIPDPLAYRQDLARCQEAIVALGHPAPTLYRAPQGRISAAGLLATTRLGLKQMNWSLESGDWRLRDADGARAVASQLINSVMAGDIVLLHDDNVWTPKVLDTLLPVLTARGFDLATAVDQFRTTG